MTPMQATFLGSFLKFVFFWVWVTCLCHAGPPQQMDCFGSMGDYVQVSFMVALAHYQFENMLRSLSFANLVVIETALLQFINYLARIISLTPSLRAAGYSLNHLPMYSMLYT